MNKRRIKMRKGTKAGWLLLFFLILFPCALAFTQTADEMDSLLQADAVSAAQAARFVLGTADLLSPDLSGPAAETTAYETARLNGWITIAAGESISLKDAAFLIMRAFELKGGIMYSLLKNPRYAYREMIYRKLIQGRVNPAMNVSGQKLLQILDSTLSYAGGVK